jgi:hypothetical protein
VPRRKRPKVSRDLERVDPGDPTDVARWAQALGVAPAELLDAIAAARTDFVVLLRGELEARKARDRIRMLLAAQRAEEG